MMCMRLAPEEASNAGEVLRVEGGAHIGKW
jgi:hypothetical protein